eukprot:Plantae.Rhodophyta-Purpureofilum_apyrenoidigerum.ctg2219.p1 GENE.Plantae.Rhodophyta-Purpureofilum_apyrenoidigerum.ctg2219~~Plantae.Rhodophyta-Purpureofilum_apyrenoidigerum.ctg2219.p1  ORF type:complete len:215 (-),score=22.36 Plantae.Rhodophyta-Purpureofilum_apyrenoidigerum.ctg2219:724-1368(-)
MIRNRVVATVLVIAVLSVGVNAKCSLSERIFKCNAASKGAFATAFAAAVSAPAVGCFTMSTTEWESVGCDNPSSHRYTKICAPAKWTPVLKLFATAMALKKKILVKSPYNRSSLFGTATGRALMRHELTHIRQQSGISSFKFGYRYISGYCDAGCSYAKNKYEVEADKYQNDSCPKPTPTPTAKPTPKPTPKPTVRPIHPKILPKFQAPRNPTH